MPGGENKKINRRTVLRSAGIALATGVGSAAVTGTAAASSPYDICDQVQVWPDQGNAAPGWNNSDRCCEYKLIDQGYAGIVREVDAANSTVRVDWHNYDYDWWM